MILRSVMVSLLGLLLAAQPLCALTQAEQDAISRALLSDEAKAGGKALELDQLPQLAKPKPPARTLSPERQERYDRRARQRADAARAKREAAARTRREQQALARRLKAGQERYAAELKAQQSKAGAAQVAYTEAAVRQKNAAKALKDYNATRTFDWLYDTAKTDTLQAELTAANKALGARKQELSTATTVLKSTVKAAQGYSRGLGLQIIKKDPAQVERVATQRVNQAEVVYQQVQTQKAQFNAGQKKFRAADRELTEKIAHAEKTGQDALAKKLTTEKDKLQRTHTQWKLGMTAELNGYRRDLQRFYQQNRKDGIGPTSTVGLEHKLRKAAIAADKDPNNIARIDTEAVERAASSAQRVASGAGKNTDHKNILDNPTDLGAIGDFAYDLTVENVKDYGKATDLVGNAKDIYEGLTTGNWKGLKDRQVLVRRFGSYLKGAARGGKDAVVDLAVFAKDAGISLAQATELATGYWTATKPNYLGRDTLNKVHSGLADLDAIVLDGSGRGQEVAAKLVEGITKAKGKLSRGVEKLAGQGEAGTQKALEYTGYGVVTVLDPTDKLLGAGLGKLGDLSKWVRGLDEAAEFARLAERLGDVDPSTLAKAAENLGGISPDELGKLADRLGPLDPGASRGLDELIGSGPLDLPPTPKGSPLAVPRAVPGESSPLKVDKNPDGSLVIQDGDKTITIGTNEKLGAGSSSYAYSDPTTKGLTGPGAQRRVVKITRPDEGALDDFGYDVIKKIDPSGDVIEVPTVHSRQQITEGTGVLDYGAPGKPDLAPLKGGSVRVVDEAPLSFRDSVKGKKDKNLNPGQRKAFHEGLEALNREGYVWLDAKADNFGFRDLGNGKYKLVILDQGGLVPVKGLDGDTARKIQKGLDDPNAVAKEAGYPAKFSPENWASSPGYGRSAHHGNLAQLYDDLIDWDALNKILNRGVTDPSARKKYNSLDPYNTDKKGVAFNPANFAEIPGNARPAGTVDVPGLKVPDEPINLPRRPVTGRSLDKLNDYQKALADLRKLTADGTLPWSMVWWDLKFLRIVNRIRDELGDEAADRLLAESLGLISLGASPEALPEGDSALFDPGLDGNGIQIGFNDADGGFDPLLGSPGDGLLGPPGTGLLSGAGPGAGTQVLIGDQFPPAVPAVQFGWREGVIPGGGGGPQDAFISIDPGSDNDLISIGGDPLLTPLDQSTVDFTVRIISINRIQGNDAWNPLDPLTPEIGHFHFEENEPHTPVTPPGSMPPTGPVIFVLSVGSSLIPVSEVFVAGPDRCAFDHYHAFFGFARTCDGGTLNDPNPTACGFGIVGSAFPVAESQCPAFAGGGPP